MTTALASYSTSLSQPAWQRLGARLERARERHAGLTLRDLSLRAGLSETYYGMIARGERRPSRRALDRILDALGVAAGERREIDALFVETHRADAERRARPLVVAESAGYEAGDEPPAGPGARPPSPGVALVIDASVLAKPFTRHDEADRAKSLRLLQRHTDGHCRITVPEFGRLEVLNAVRFSRLADERQTLDVMRALDRFQLDFVPLTTRGLERAVELSWQRGISIYDAAYVALADTLETLLITADSRLSARLRGHARLRLLGEFEMP
jgi:predicted nucleic acid-binding protein